VTTRREDVIGVLADILGRESAELTDEKRLEQDLIFDDLDYIEVETAFEETFGIEFHDSELEAMNTVGELVALVIEKSSAA
jgi:acyl carrier protein